MLGLDYVADVVSLEEEAALLAWMQTLTLEPFAKFGLASNRLIASFGARAQPPRPFPPELEPLRHRCADLAGLDAPQFSEAMVTWYPAGAGIGWHRDYPQFGPVVLGVSLVAACRLRMRPVGGGEVQVVELRPRSLYVLAEDARGAWEHAIPAVPVPRWSVTFRSLRRRGENGSARILGT